MILVESYNNVNQKSHSIVNNTYCIAKCDENVDDRLLFNFEVLITWLARVNYYRLNNERVLILGISFNENVIRLLNVYRNPTRKITRLLFFV